MTADGATAGARGRLLCVVALLLVVAAGALMLRLHELELRPFHPDEAVQAVKTGGLLDSGSYRYDPFEHHGPSLYYLTIPVLRLAGAGDFADAGVAEFRLLPVAFGVGMVLLLLPMRRDLGPLAVIVAGVLVAISPAMVFYSRYYIQETLLVFFSGLMVVAVWRFMRSRSFGWAALAGFAAGMMFATKETGVISFGAIFLAVAAVAWRRGVRNVSRLRQVSRAGFPAMLLGLGIALLVIVAFYSSFFQNARGPFDSLLAFRHYFDRIGGDGSEAVHRHPWYYYLKLLSFTRNAPGPWWSEGFVLLLAFIGMACAFFRKALPVTIRGDAAWFITVYTLVMTAAFAVIPYKTPWNLLGFHLGLIWLAGIGASVVFHRIPNVGLRGVWLIFLLAGAVQLAGQAWRATHRFSADPRNPYVYAHSVPDVVRLSQRIHELSALHEDGAAMRIHFITPDYWPMPYYLRGMSKVGYWNEVPAEPDAPVMVVNAELQELVEARLDGSYHSEFYGLRPGVLLVLNVREDLWQRYLKGKTGAPDKMEPGSK